MHLAIAGGRRWAAQRLNHQPGQSATSLARCACRVRSDDPHVFVGRLRPEPRSCSGDGPLAKPRTARADFGALRDTAGVIGKQRRRRAELADDRSAAGRGRRIASLTGARGWAEARRPRCPGRRGDALFRWASRAPMVGLPVTAKLAVTVGQNRVARRMWSGVWGETTFRDPVSTTVPRSRPCRSSERRWLTPASAPASRMVARGVRCRAMLRRVGTRRSRSCR